MASPRPCPECCTRLLPPRTDAGVLSMRANSIVPRSPMGLSDRADAGRGVVPARTLATAGETDGMSASQRRSERDCEREREGLIKRMSGGLQCQRICQVGPGGCPDAIEVLSPWKWHPAALPPPRMAKRVDTPAGSRAPPSVVGTACGSVARIHGDSTIWSSDGRAFGSTRRMLVMSCFAAGLTSQRAMKAVDTRAEQDI